MYKYRSGIILIIFLLNVSSLFFSVSIASTPVFQDKNLQKLQNDTFIGSYENVRSLAIPVENNHLSMPKEEIVPTVFQPRFSIQQRNSTPLLNLTGIKDVDSVHFERNIWKNQLGSDPIVLSNPSLYQNGLNVTNSTIFPLYKIGADELEVVNNSLFVRIGNNGYGSNYTVPEDQNDPNENISGGISAGWQINFSIGTDYDVIQVSFKWRFDAFDPGAFDNFTEPPLNWLDASPDYQEVRCRIKHPDSDQSSFWLGNPVSQQNPNGTVFYRVGPIIEKDEEWFLFNYSFYLPQTEDIILELGAYLNTREYYNEYFDVWFDDILIQGINNITDSYPPQPGSFELGRTTDVSIWEFWANFSEGKWETPIKNITVVFSNQSGVPSSRSLNLVTSSINEAGYNESHWQYPQSFTFGENISYKLIIYDEAENYKETDYQNTVIGDFEAPEITSTLNITDSNFVHQLGNGTVIISIGTHDWGNATHEVMLNYTLEYRNGTKYHDEIPMSKNGTDFQAKLLVDFGTVIEFGILLNDTAGNSRDYPGYSIVSDLDIIPPNVNLKVDSSMIEEGRTFVNVVAEDSFGEIDQVFLVIQHENGTFHSNLTLVYDNVTKEYKLGTVLNLKYDEKYNMTVFVRDKGGSTSSSTEIFIVPDLIAPRVSIEDLEYLHPGLLRIWVQANDLGSGIESVMLERRNTDGWVYYANMTLKNNKYFADISTDWIGNEQIKFRINAIDKEGNEIVEENRPTRNYTTKIFFSTIIGLVITEILLVTAIVGIFASIKIAQLQRVKAIRRKRFDLALDRSERLAYLGEEAMFGFIAAYGQSEGVASMLLWEPRLIGYFHQYLKELIDKANNNVAFIMRAKAQDLVSYVDFNIEEIGCSAVTFAYPVSSLPQQWLAALTLDQVPIGAGQGVLLLLLVMREKWSEISHNFQDEIADGMLELKDLILSGEDNEIILQKSREFRLFISGTLEVLDEIETDTDEISDDIMGDFETELSDIPDEDSLQDETDDNETSDDDYRF